MAALSSMNQAAEQSVMLVGMGGLKRRFKMSLVHQGARRAGSKVLLTRCVSNNHSSTLQVTQSRAAPS